MVFRALQPQHSVLCLPPLALGGLHLILGGGQLSLGALLLPLGGGELLVHGGRPVMELFKLRSAA